jgi:hypothetical protein
LLFAAFTCAFSQSRHSTGYEGGKSAPASPRVSKSAAKVAGGKRKSATATASSRARKSRDEESQASEEGSYASTADSSTVESSPRPAKKSRTAKAPAKAATASSKRASAAGGKKGRRAASRQEEEEEEAENASEQQEDEAQSRASEDEMEDVKSAPVKPVAPMKAAAAKGRASLPAAAAASVPAVPYVDPSLFAASSDDAARKPGGSVDVEDVGEEEEEEEDVEMRSPSPSPRRSPSTSNPFQSGSSHATPEQPSFAPASSLLPPLRAAFAARASSGVAPPKFGSPTPFTQALRPSASDEGGLRPSSFIPSPYKYNPALRQSAPYAFSPSGGFQAGLDASGGGRSFGVSVSPMADRSESANIDEDALSGLPPPTFGARPSTGRVSFGFPSTQQQRTSESEERELEDAEGGAAPRESQPYMRRSTGHWSQEQKYGETKEPESPQADEADSQTDEQQASEQFKRAARRYTDHVPAEGVSPATVLPWKQRARRFCSSLSRFLLRTLVISLMVLTISVLLMDNSLRRALFGAPLSSTVFCPSGSQAAPTLPLPAGQLICIPCPTNGHCTLEGRLECDEMHVREGDACVLNDEAHRRAFDLKGAMVDILEKRLGDYECGLLEKGVEPSMTTSELLLALPQAQPPIVHDLAIQLLSQDAAPEEDRAITTAAVLRKAPLGPFWAHQPQRSLQCTLNKLFKDNLWHILGASFILSLISQCQSHTAMRDGTAVTNVILTHCLLVFSAYCAAYVYFQLKLWLWRRKQTPLVTDAVHDRLRSAFDYVGATKPLAVAHLKEEYLSGQLTGVRGDVRVWDRVVKRVERDSRIERSKYTFGSTVREAWTWTAPLEQSRRPSGRGAY